MGREYHPEHDDLCPVRSFHHPGGPSETGCQCDLIAEVRGDERERIARAIEEQREQFIRVTRAERDGIIVKVYDDAARIARQGGSDDQ